MEEGAPRRETRRRRSMGLLILLAGAEGTPSERKLVWRGEKAWFHDRKALGREMFRYEGGAQHAVRGDTKPKALRKVGPNSSTGEWRWV